MLPINTIRYGDLLHQASGGVVPLPSRAPGLPICTPSCPAGPTPAIISRFHRYALQGITANRCQTSV
jgi:hypothetical protein